MFIFLIISVVNGMFFYSPECTSCIEVMDSLLPVYTKKYHLNITYYSLEDSSNMKLLMEIEDKYKDYDNSIPVLIIGNQILGNEKEIKEKLPLLISKLKEKSGLNLNIGLPSPPINLSKPVYVAYFYNPRCSECDKVSYILRFYQKRYPTLRIQRFNVFKGHNQELLEAIEEKINVPENKRLVTPILIIGNDYIFYPKGDTLDIILEKYSQSGSPPFWKNINRKIGEENILRRFQKFGILGVFIAGLIDGINPCAFATIIFFVTYLAIKGRTPKEILLVGLSFTFAIFLSYIGIGMGLFKFLAAFSAIGIFSKIFFGLTGFLCLFLGIISFLDAVKAKKGRVDKMTLKLPEYFRNKIKEKIREKGRIERVVMGSFILGIIVSFLEFSCTGQVYFPTLVFISSIPEYRMEALRLILFYNIAFIFPLIFVFILAFFGITQERLNTLLQRNIVLVKIATGLIFIGLGIILIKIII